MRETPFADKLEEKFVAILNCESDAVGNDLGHILSRIDDCNESSESLIQTISAIIEENKQKKEPIYKKVNAILNKELGSISSQHSPQLRR